MIILRHTTFGRTPLDEGAAYRRDLYLTSHNTHKIKTSIPMARIEPATPASELPEIHVLDHEANWNRQTIVTAPVYFKGTKLSFGRLELVKTGYRCLIYHVTEQRQAYRAEILLHRGLTVTPAVFGRAMKETPDWYRKCNKVLRTSANLSAKGGSAFGRANS